MAFTSAATNLAPGGDANGRVRDVFVFDQGTSGVTLVSTAFDGRGADGPSDEPVLSANAGIVAFSSNATNLVADDRNLVTDIFARVGGNGPVRVSLAPGGAEANGRSSQPDLSGDGRSVVFTSHANNLTAGDSNGLPDVFVRDLATGVTSLVSAARSGAAARGSSSAPAISPDGRFVSFSSTASNLVERDDNGLADVFLRNLATGQTSLISAARAGGGQNRALNERRAAASDVSRDGRFVVFESDATNLAGRDRNGATDVFVRDRVKRATRRVSVSVTDDEGGGASFLPTITPDGRFVAFLSRADDLVPESAFGLDVFVRDLVSDTTVLANVTARGRPRGSERSAPPVERPSLSTDAGTVAFASSASNLAGSDGNGLADVFLRRLLPAASATALRRVGLVGGRLLIVFQTRDRGAGPLQCRLDGRPPILCPLGGLLLPRLRGGFHVLRAFAGASGSLYARRPIVVRIHVRGKGAPRVRVENPGDAL